MKILWLVSWYPSKVEPFAGDFIQRHAQAASLYHDIHVIHVVRDAKGEFTKDVRIEESQRGRLHERIIYYYSPFYSSVAGKFFSQLKYNRLFAKSIDQYVREQGRPDGIHVHVGMKAGLMAMRMLRREKFPYVVTEHWTGFLPEAKDRIGNMPSYMQNAWKLVLKKAAGISAVSGRLAQQLRSFSGKEKIMVIPNVVNTDLFFPVSQKEKQLTRFIHISGLDHQKNPEAILKALAIVKTRTGSFHLDVFGPERRDVSDLVKKLGLENHTRMHGEVPQKELAPYLQQSDALILYSRYETFGCVVIEANACGVPVIASDIPVMHELLEEDRNGFFVTGDDSQALADKLVWFIENRPRHDANMIAKECSEKYSYNVVGRQFSNWYETIFSSGK